MKLSIIQNTMDIQAKKLKVILNIEDHDWFNGLTEDQQQSLTKALEQADREEGIPHEEALTRLGL